jgi:hypothetical protein
VKETEKLKIDGSPISFEKWRIIQPIADRAVGIVNKIVKKNIKNL